MKQQGTVGRSAAGPVSRRPLCLVIDLGRQVAVPARFTTSAREVQVRVCIGFRAGSGWNSWHELAFAPESAYTVQSSFCEVCLGVHSINGCTPSSLSARSVGMLAQVGNRVGIDI